MKQKPEKPIVMVSKTQEQKLRKLGLWREPTIPPINYFENMIKNAYKRALKDLK